MKRQSEGESVAAMVRECRDAVRSRGRDALFAAMACGNWMIPMGSRLVAVKVADVGDFEAKCRGLTDDEVGEYLAYATGVLILKLIETKGEAFFRIPGPSSLTVMLCIAPLGELRSAFGEEEP